MADFDDEDPIGTAMNGVESVGKEIGSTIKGLGDQVMGEIKNFKAQAAAGEQSKGQAEAMGALTKELSGLKQFLGGGNFKPGSIGDVAGKELPSVVGKAQEKGIGLDNKNNWIKGAVPDVKPPGIGGPKIGGHRMGG